MIVFRNPDKAASNEAAFFIADGILTFYILPPTIYTLPRCVFFI